MSKYEVRFDLADGISIGSHTFKYGNGPAKAAISLKTRKGQRKEHNMLLEDVLMIHSIVDQCRDALMACHQASLSAEADNVRVYHGHIVTEAEAAKFAKGGGPKNTSSAKQDASQGLVDPTKQAVQPVAEPAPQQQAAVDPAALAAALAALGFPVPQGAATLAPQQPAVEQPKVDPQTALQAVHGKLMGLSEAKTRLGK